MSILILGDVHLGKGLSLGKSGLGTSLNSRVVDQLNLLDWTLDQAIDNDVNTIVITGDIFEEPNPDSTLIYLFIEWINKCDVNNVKVIIIRGNHDVLRTGNYYLSPLDIINVSNLSNCRVIADIDTILLNDIAITLLPFRDRKSFNVESNAAAIENLRNLVYYELTAIPLPYTKILIGHLALEGSIPIGDEIDDMTNELFCPLNMFEGYDYVIMGHVHKPQVLQETPFIAHIGSMDISNFGEIDHTKHIVIFDTDTLKYSTINLPTRTLTKLAITIPKDVSDTTKHVLEEIKNSKLDLSNTILRLEVSFESSESKSINRGEIEKSLYDSGVFNIAGFSESKKINLIRKDSVSSNNIDNTMDPTAAIKTWADKKWPNDTNSLKKSKFINFALSVFKDHKAGVKV